MSDSVKKRGRPPSSTELNSANVNYQALAWQAKLRMDEAEKIGKKITLIAAVRAEIELSAIVHKGKNKNEAQWLMDAKIDTHYTKVRKIIKGWKQANQIITKE